MLLALNKLEPIDVGELASKISEFKQEWYNQGKMRYIIIAWITQLIIITSIYIVHKLISDKNEFEKDKIHKDTLIFAVLFSFIIVLLLQRYTHIIEVISSFNYPAALKIGKYSALRNWYSYVLLFVLWCLKWVKECIYATLSLDIFKKIDWDAIYNENYEPEEISSHDVIKAILGLFAIIIVLSLITTCIIKIVEMFKRGLSGLEICVIVDCLLLQIFVIGAIPSHIVLVYEYFMELGEKTEAFLSLGSALGVIIWFASPFLICACAKAIMEK